MPRVTQGFGPAAVVASSYPRMEAPWWIRIGYMQMSHLHICFRQIPATWLIKLFLKSSRPAEYDLLQHLHLKQMQMHDEDRKDQRNECLEGDLPTVLASAIRSEGLLFDGMPRKYVVQFHVQIDAVLDCFNLLRLPHFALLYLLAHSQVLRQLLYPGSCFYHW